MRIISLLLTLVVCVIAIHARTYDVDIVKMDIPDKWVGMMQEAPESDSSSMGHDIKDYGRAFDRRMKAWRNDSAYQAIIAEKFVMTDGRDADLEFLQNYANTFEKISINWVKDKENQWHADFLVKDPGYENGQIIYHFVRKYVRITVNGKTGHVIALHFEGADAETFANLRDIVRKAVLK